MAFSSSKLGFSTGAISKGDFQHALEVVRSLGLSVVEISALREHELPRLARALPSLDISGFEYVAVHAPSRFRDLSEGDAAHLLSAAAARQINIVVHPDTIREPSLWRQFGRLLLIENLDKRKTTARTTDELHTIFASFPEAGFCLDVAHARQVDPTMAEATNMLRSFGSKLRQIHASGLNANSTHGPLSAAAGFAFSKISHMIPPSVPVILESPVAEDAIRPELAFARRAFSPWLERLVAEIDDVFDVRIPSLREQQIASFLSLLQTTGTRLSDFEHVISQLPSGGAYKRGDMFLTANELLNRLSEDEKASLRQYLSKRIAEIAGDFPELREHYKYQFS